MNCLLTIFQGNKKTKPANIFSVESGLFLPSLLVSVASIGVIIIFGLIYECCRRWKIRRTGSLLSIYKSYKNSIIKYYFRKYLTLNYVLRLSPVEINIRVHVQKYVPGMIPKSSSNKTFFKSSKRSK